VELIGFGPSRAVTIDRFDSTGTGSVHLGFGEGEAHVYVLHFAAGGEIGRHEAAFGQLFVVVDGAGWVEGDRSERAPIVAGEAAYFRRGEVHAKGSDTGMVAVMVQVRDLDLLREERTDGEAGSGG
jgi:quercetin dioxygenase-like cupin family protein